MNGRILTCVYCGHEYPQDTPAAGSQVLTEHIKVCERHPMRKAEGDIALLRGALVGLIGADGEDDLRQMEATMRLLPAPDADKAVSINAIHALLATMPPNAEVSGGVSRPLDWRVMGLKTTEKDMGIVEKLRAYRPIDETSRLIVDAATEIERLQQGGEILRGELQKARHDLMVRETAKDERIADVEAAGHRLALELECLLMDTKDLPVVSMWWDSAQVALAMWQMLDQQPHISPLGMD